MVLWCYEYVLRKWLSDFKMDLEPRLHILSRLVNKKVSEKSSLVQGWNPYLK